MLSRRAQLCAARSLISSSGPTQNVPFSMPYKVSSPRINSSPERFCAIADWQKLLATDPNYGAKDKVVQMISGVKKQETVQPGMNAN
jgi:hypothetical protein